MLIFRCVNNFSPGFQDEVLDETEAAGFSTLEHKIFSAVQCNRLSHTRKTVTNSFLLNLGGPPVPQLRKTYRESGAQTHLYPDGRYDFSHKKDHRIVFGSYIKLRMFQDGSGYARDMSWIFHMATVLTLYTINSQSFVWNKMSTSKQRYDRSEFLFRAESSWHCTILRATSAWTAGTSCVLGNANGSENPTERIS